MHGLSPALHESRSLCEQMAAALTQVARPHAGLAASGILGGIAPASGSGSSIATPTVLQQHQSRLVIGAEGWHVVTLKAS